MKTFQKVSKKAMLKELRWHATQDKIIQGDWGDIGESFKGCHIGCSANSIARINNVDIDPSSIRDVSEYIGIPVWLGHMFEKVFEKLPEDKCNDWVINSIDALPDNKEIPKTLKANTLIFILQSTLDTHKDKKINKITNDLIKAIKDDDQPKIRELRYAAYDAAYAAAYARQEFYIKLSEFLIKELRR